ncbi:MAG: hypothetical protein SGJ15_05240 [Bacteroidota bacterium]|nr:hypothetical protein [Bacteroidota bacterium]
MAIRGKVKNIRDMGSGYTGTVTDTAAKVDYNFSSPCGKELGLKDNMIVRMEIITLNDGTGAKLAVSLDPVEKGTIVTTNAANNSGTLTDNTGNTVGFVQDYITELGLAAGDRVSYAMVNYNGAMVATAIQK